MSSICTCSPRQKDAGRFSKYCNAHHGWTPRPARKPRQPRQPRMPVLTIAQQTALAFAALPIDQRHGARSGLTTRRNSLGLASQATWRALQRLGLVSGPPWVATARGWAAIDQIASMRSIKDKDLGGTSDEWVVAQPPDV